MTPALELDVHKGVGIVRRNLWHFWRLNGHVEEYNNYLSGSICCTLQPGLAARSCRIRLVLPLGLAKPSGLDVCNRARQVDHRNEFRPGCLSHEIGLSLAPLYTAARRQLQLASIQSNYPRYTRRGCIVSKIS